MAYPQADTIRSSDYGYGYGSEEKSYNSMGYTPDPVSSNYPVSRSSIEQPQQQPLQQQQPQMLPAEEKKKTKVQSLVERYCTDVNYDLLVSKTFYFFFFAAFGSLFPLIGIYFKQLGMNPAQTGVLIGFRPFVELVAGPFWNNLAFRYKKLKKILIGSLICWIVFTLSLAFVQTDAHLCLVHNSTHVYVMEPYTIDGLEHAEFKNAEHFNDMDEARERVRRGTMADSFVQAKLDNLRSVKLPLYYHGSALTKKLKRAVEISDGFEVQAIIDPDDESPGEEEGEKNNDGKSDKHLEKNVKSEKERPKANEKVVEPPNPREKIHENQHDRVVKPIHGSSKHIEENPKEITKPAQGSGKGKLVVPHPVHPVPVSSKLREEEEEQNAGKHHHGPAMQTSQQLYRFYNLPYPEIKTYGYSPLHLDHNRIMNLDESNSVNLVSPPMSAVVYRVRDIQSIFLILLMLQILGEFLSTPAISVADIATLEYVDNDVEQYGRQRMFGSVGWAIAMFFVGFALDYSNIFPNHPCGTEHIVDRNYMTCYAIFGVLMSVALLVATQFKFKVVDTSFQSINLTQFKDKVTDKFKSFKGEEGSSKSAGNNGDNHGVQISLEASNRPDMISDVGGTGDFPATRPSPFIPRGILGHPGTVPQWITVLKLFAPIQHSSMLFILWYTGFGVGLVFSFLFWHLQDIRGTPTLFGIASVVSHVSEIAAFFLIKKLVSKFGYLNVIYVGLSANFIRFIFISIVSRPWWVLPFELLQGLTHAGVWAAGCSYLTQFIPLASRPTAQVILISLHHALGRGCGAIIGGALINSYGTVAVFRGYGISCIFVTAAFVALHFLYIQKLPAAQPTHGDATGMSMESAYLAPHGVPSSMPHSMSNSQVEKENSSYNQGGGTSTNGYNMDSGANRGQQYGDIYNGPPKGIYEDYGYGYSLDPIKDDQIFWQSPKMKPVGSEGARASNGSRTADGVKRTERLVMNAAPKAPVQFHKAQPPAVGAKREDSTDLDYLY